MCGILLERGLTGMATGNIYIGTSGWSYKHWKEHFYPPKLKATEWLAFYAKTFSVTEINTTFYHLPKEQTVLNWIEKVPEGFKFCPKISRYITHMKKLREPEEPLKRFFDIFQSVKHFLGPILVQLPPALKFNQSRADHFFSLLKSNYYEYEFVLEIRHDSWLQEESITLMKKYDIGFVVSQSEQFPYSEAITAKNIYIRFHGPRELYASGYSDEMLFWFAEKFRSHIKEGHTLWAFFNNDIQGHAFRDAQRLQELMQ